MKRVTKTAAHVDLAYGWKRYLCYLSRPGVSSKIKREIRRIERHDAKRALRRDDE